MFIDVIAGTRPNFVKIAPIIRTFEARQAKGTSLDYRLIYTGQHFHARLSDEFFPELGLPDPDVHFRVGTGSPAEQTGRIMARYEELLSHESPALTLVVGDVTSTMACAIAAKKARVQVGHVEAGIRSGDRTMPEEINSLVTDAIADLFFTTSPTADENLRQAGVGETRIHRVGNTMIDTLLASLSRARLPRAGACAGPGGFLVLTLHRPANVDDPQRLARLLATIAQGARGLPLIFPAHPRTSRTLRQINGLPSNLRLLEPLPYLDFIGLLRDAKAVLTDSGGVQEETTVLGVPCLTLRETTERPETVSQGTNELVGSNPAALLAALDRLFAGNCKQGTIPELWDGRAAARLVDILERHLA